MKFKKGDKAQLANGTAIIVTQIYSAHDGMAYKAMIDEGKDFKNIKLTAAESALVCERDSDSCIGIGALRAIASVIA